MREPTERHRAETAEPVPDSGDTATGSAGAGDVGRIHSGLVLRAARESDLEILARIGLYAWQAAIGLHAPGSAWKRVRDEKPFVDFLAAQSGDVIVATEDGEPVAFAAFDATDGHVGDIWVAPSAWASGIGSALLAELEMRLKDAGMQTATADVFAKNRRALKFFESRGYGETARATRLDTMAGADLEMVTLTKTLAG